MLRMSRTGPLLHVLAILLLVVPAVFLLTSRDDPAKAQEGAPAGRATLTLADWPADPAAVRGRVVYEKWCIGCHGDEGRGDGDAARWLNPLPRNFQSGQFKFRSTPSGQLPTADDLLHTITCGLAGSSMPGFPLVPLTDRKDVVAYVQHIAGFGLAKREVDYLIDEEGMSLDEVIAESLPELREEIRAKIAGVQKIPVPVAPPVTDELIAKGKEIFDVQCAACHGATGRGDGSSSYTLRDYKDSEIRPRDFTTGVFRAGSSPEVLYLRLRSGLAGTPMPAIPGADEEIWAQVYYMMSMRDPDAKPTWVPPVCGGEESHR
jgi:cytochrome c oxidase cbb3-type subunit 2